MTYWFSDLLHLNPALYVVIVFIYVGGLIWLANDVNDRWGQEGCIPVAAFYFVFAPVFPIVLIVYILLRQLAYRRPAQYEREESDDAWSWRSKRQQGGAAQGSAPGMNDAERDEKIDEFMEQGKLREAMDYAQQMYKMAQDFKDTAGQVRYSKYIERIRRGVK